MKIVVPRRSDGGRRDQLWAYCRRQWAEHFPAWTITEGHDDHGPFNRGRAINDAARAAGPFDVLLIIDGDVWADPGQIQAAVERAHETGRMTLAYSMYRALDRHMTDRVLDGFDGDWGRGKFKMAHHCSSIVAVPAPLWARVGGFDERIEGHGADDLILTHACRVLGGGIERIPGDVFHLDHPRSPEDDRKAPLRIAAHAICDRLLWETDPAKVQEMIAERSSTGAVMVVPTHGRRECIERAIPSALENLKGIPVEHVIISDDSGDIEYQAWLRHTFPDAEVVHGKHGGFATNVRRGWLAALANGRPWIVWWEDDFILERPVDLRAMADMTERFDLLQMVLLRQPWFPSEVQAGGVLEANPGMYDHHEIEGHEWASFGAFWTNPFLAPRKTLARNQWPTGGGSEASFSRAIARDGRQSGYWLPDGGAPIVTHIGDRNGSGY